jgi:hypothetical protein
MFCVNRKSEKVETQLIETNTYYYWEFATFIGIGLKKTQHIASQFHYEFWLTTHQHIELYDITYIYLPIQLSIILDKHLTTQVPSSVQMH